MAKVTCTVIFNDIIQLSTWVMYWLSTKMSQCVERVMFTTENRKKRNY